MRNSTVDINQAKNTENMLISCSFKKNTRKKEKIATNTTAALDHPNKVLESEEEPGLIKRIRREKC